MLVKLKATHTHADIEYGPGDALNLPDDSAQSLIDQDRAERLDTDIDPEEKDHD